MGFDSGKKTSCIDDQVAQEIFRRLAGLSNEHEVIIGKLDGLTQKVDEILVLIHTQASGDAAELKVLTDRLKVSSTALKSALAGIAQPPA
jgi:hypothetical protein